jgi:hypothetical protein
LQSFFDTGKDPTQRLNEALNIMQNNSAAKADDKVFSELSLAQIIGFDMSLLDKDIPSIISYLKEEAFVLDDDPSLREIFFAMVQELELKKTNEELLLLLLQFYSPLPFPYRVEALDEEFEEDEDELLGKKKHKGEEDEEDEDDDIDYDSSLSLSLTTLNFNKLHLLIKYSSTANKLLLKVIGDPIATELLIPIETNLECDIGDDIDDLEQMLKTWHDNVSQITESRILKIRSTGELNPILIKACTSILQTVNQSDIDLSEDDVIDSDYRLL